MQRGRLGPRLALVGRVLFGREPRALLPLLAPTGLAILMDLVLRARALAGYALQGKAIYASSWLISAAFWTLPLWLGAKLLQPRTGGAATSARAAFGALLLLWLVPFATLCYGGQALYFRVFHSYVGRDTVRLGIALRGTVRDWFVSWSSPILLGGMLLGGLLVTAGMVRLMRRASPRLGGVPILPILTFPAALVCFWTDNVDSRFLQAATPDACFVHGIVHAIRAATTGQGRVRQGVSLRTPAPLPPLAKAMPTSPNVIVILTESVRADSTCSERAPGCSSPFFDEVVPERIALGKLTSQTPNTFSACMVLWTGLSPNVDFASAHTAPVLWEIARAVGYETAYITSQNPDYEDFGAFVRNAGIDVLATALDLGGLGQEQLGAPDENATREMLRFLKGDHHGKRVFAVLHLSNTHAPYRTDKALLPFLPESDDPIGDVLAFHNHYRNSVRLQERTVTEFLKELRALPMWDDTVVLFLSDHGEQFREHGGLYHNHSLYDEETRIPGWLVAGDHALGAAPRAALVSYRGARTYPQDVHATVVDLLGLHDAAPSLPLASLVQGRSLLRPRVPGQEPVALMATSTAVWEPDDAWFGAGYGEWQLAAPPTAPWLCFDRAHDPEQRRSLPQSACPTPLRRAATTAFPGIGNP